MSILEAGAELGRYTILGRLATGGMSEIYLARQSGPSGFSKILVLKVILTHLSEDHEFLNMFHNEAKLAALLNHPNVVQIFDFGVEDESHFMAMEYIDGLPLLRILEVLEQRNEHISRKVALRIISDVSGALEYAHSLTDANGHTLDLIHRDVSLDNILVTYSGQVKLVDFGIAKAKHLESYTSVGHIRGKYRYMAPELIRGEKLDRRVDLFSMGVVIYRMLLGRMPFEGDNHAQLINSIIRKEPRPPREIKPDLPEELERIILKCLEKDRQKRYQHAGEIQIDLEGYLLGSGTVVMPFHLSQYMAQIFPPGSDPLRETYRRLTGATITRAKQDQAGQAGVHQRARSPAPSAIEEPTALIEHTPPPQEMPPEKRDMMRSTLVEMAPTAAAPTHTPTPSHPAGLPAHTPTPSQPSGLPAHTPTPSQPSGLPAHTPTPSQPSGLPAHTPTPSQPSGLPAHTPTPSHPVGLPSTTPPQSVTPSDPGVAVGPVMKFQPMDPDAHVAPADRKTLQDFPAISAGEDLADVADIEDVTDIVEMEPDEEEDAGIPVDSRILAHLEPEPPSPRRFNVVLLALVGAIILVGGVIATIVIISSREKTGDVVRTPAYLDDAGSAALTTPDAGRLLDGALEVDANLEPDLKRVKFRPKKAVKPLPDARPPDRAATRPRPDSRRPIRTATRPRPDSRRPIRTVIRPRPDARPARKAPTPPAPPPPPPASMGRLSVSALLPGTVHIDGKRVGSLPLKFHRLPVGQHRIQVRGTKHRYTMSQTVEVKAGGHQQLQLTPKKGTIRILVRPWAKVTLDGKALGTTPLPPVTVYEGPHSVVLENKDLQVTKRKRVQVKPGQVSTLKVRLE